MKCKSIDNIQDLKLFKKQIKKELGKIIVGLYRVEELTGYNKKISIAVNLLQDALNKGKF